MKPDQTIFDYLEKLGFDPNTVSYLFCNNFVIAEYNPLYSENIYYKDKFELQFFFYKKDNPKILDQYYLEKWNENKLNFLIAINENKTFILDIKQKPSQENTTSLNLDSFNYGTNSKDFEAKKLEPLLKENIDNSYFWDYVIKRRKTVTEVDDDLLSNLVALHKNLTEGNNNYEEINLLILQCLFVKYLEERNIFDEEQILKKALQHNNDKELKNVFEKIKSINGDIFSNIKFTVSSKQLKELYIFFKHDYLEFKEKKQPSIIFPYKFDKIPIELISNVYEEFLGKTDKNKKESQGIFYTRSFVVDFMLSHSVYEQVNSNKKITILDPACGSGIFLVQSYKAILKQNLDLSIDDKIAILQSQIFGIDIDGRALQIAAFSLYLALLASCTENEIKDRIEKQKPMLPNLIGINLLNKNTITDNITFFVGNNTIQSFDCIVGNPPWGQIEEAVFPLENSLELLREHNIPDSIIDKMCNVAIKTDKFSQNLKKILDSEERKYINKIVKYSDIETDERVKERRSINKSNGLYSNVSHYQKSQCFLLRIDQWCNENTAISFIVNNSNFLNNESQKFRKELIQKYNILNYYDLSNISDILFKHTKEPCSVIIMDKLKSVENVFTYHTAQLTEIAKILRLIHFSSHDMKKIKQSDLLIEGQDIIWKIFVNGNWDDYQLTKKYELSKSKAFTLVCQRGFQLQKNEKNKPYKLVPLKLSDYDQYYINYPDFEKFDWKRVFFRLPLPKSFSSIFFKDNILSNFNNKDKDFILKYYRYSKKHNKYRVHKTSPSEKLKINNLLASVNSSLFTGDKILISRTPLNTKKMKCVFTSKKIPFEDNTLCLKCNWIKDYRLLLAILNSSFIGYYYLYFMSFLGRC